MSRFEELCQAFTTSRNNYIAYRDDCFRFAQVFHEGLKKYLGVTDGNLLKPIPAKTGADPDANWTVMRAMHLAEDTFWHLGLLLTIHEKANVFPKDYLQFRIRIKKVGDKFQVRFFDNGQNHEVSEVSAAALEPIFAELFSEVERTYKQGLEQFLDSKINKRQIGFKQQS